MGRYLFDRGELAGIVLNAVGRQRDADSIRSCGSVPIFVWPSDPHQVAAETEPTRLVSVLFSHRLTAEWLDLGSAPPVNLHPGYLPWNRGADPGVWPIVDGSPAGATLHVMSAAIDEGEVIAQRTVEVSVADTAASLYERLIEESFRLFTECWPRIDQIDPVPQQTGGSMHRRADLATLDPTPDDWDLIDRLRARSFPPYGAEVERDGRRLRLILEVEDITFD